MRASIRAFNLLACFAGASFAAAAYWTRQTFGPVTAEQALFHLQFGFSGVLSADRTLVLSFLRWCIGLPTAVACLVAVLQEVASLRPENVTRKVGALLGEYFSPITRRWSAAAYRVGIWILALPLRSGLCVVPLIAGLLYFLREFDFGAFVAAQESDDPFADLYVRPEKVVLRPTSPKSLVLIYLESVENTYSNEKLFGRNLLSGLEGVKGLGVSFPRFVQMPGTEWTMAGLTGTQCGIPLRSMTIWEPNRQGEHLLRFLPGATCLGQLLSAQGYRNVFLGGASLDFAGKGQFLRDHGYQEIYGREEWIHRGIPSSRMNAWGLGDADLFAEVERKVEELRSTSTPFLVTVLTVGTHHPSGFLDEKCRSLGYSDFEGAVECTSREVAELIRHGIDRSWLDGANIVILGDHLSMKNTSYAKLDRIRERTIFNLFISKERFVARLDTVTHFDMLPTMLDFIGLEVPGGRMGLGRSAFGPAPPEPWETWRAAVRRASTSRSAAYSRLWVQ
jgi:phosphoglycerol transferase